MFYQNPVFNQPLNAWDVTEPRRNQTIQWSRARRQGLRVQTRRTNVRAVATLLQHIRMRPTHPPQVGNVDLQYMFSYDHAFNQPLNAWDVAAPRERVDRRRLSLSLSLIDRRSRARPRDLGTNVAAAVAGLARQEHG